MSPEQPSRGGDVRRKRSVFIEPKKQSRIFNRRTRRRIGVALWLFIAPVCTVLGQQVLAPPPAYSVTPPALQDYETNLPGARPAELAPAVNETEQSWLQAGPVVVHPHALYRFLYGNGIQSSPGQQQDTAVNEFSPGALFVIGKHWTLDYTPTFSYYSDSRFQSTVDQNVSLNWGTTYQNWVFGLSQSYTASSAPTIQTAAQTSTEIYATAVTVNYQYNSKMSIDIAINQNISSAQQFVGSSEWSTMEWLNFSLWAKADIGVGAGYDFSDVSAGPDVMDEQLQGRIRWRFSDRTSFSLNGGLQDQQYLTNNGGSRLTPVFGASLQWQPRDATTVSLTANKSTSASLFQNQVVEATTLGVNLNQRLFKRLNLSLSGSYGLSTYVASAAGVFPNRTDTYYSFGARLNWSVLKRGTAAIFYQYSDNSSTLPGFGFPSSQIGLELGYRL
jgi:hypothetical protein